MASVLKRQLWFDSSHFAITPGEDEETNPGRFGRAFAQWVAEGLKARGMPVEGVVPEDWGWCVVLTRDPCPIWVGCGNEDESTTRWGAFLEVEPGLLQKLFGRVDRDGLWSQYWPRIEGLLRTVPGASNFETEELP